MKQTYTSTIPPIDPQLVVIRSVQNKQITYYHTWDRVPIAAMRSEIIFTCQDLKLVLTTITTDIATVGDKTLYCVGGGNMFADSAQNVSSFREIARHIEGVRKIVVFESYTACPRSFNADTGELLARVLLETSTKAPHMAPIGTVVAVGTSTGSIPVARFITELAKTDSHKAYTLIELEPCGFVANRRLARRFLALPLHIFQTERERGRSAWQSLLAIHRQIIYAWGVQGDKTSSFKNIVLEVLWNRRRFLNRQHHRFGIPGARPSDSIPYRDLARGVYAPAAAAVRDPVRVLLVFTSRSIDPVVIRNQSESAKRLRRDLRAVYGARVFSQLPTSHLTVRLIDGTHLLKGNIDYSVRIGELIDDFLHGRHQLNPDAEDAAALTGEAAAVVG